MRQILLAGNWKMHKTLAEVKAYFEVFLKGLEKIDLSGKEIMIAPPFTALAYSRKLTEGSPVKLGAQNACWEEKGAFTGEISPMMLKELGIEYVILGHSERRHIFGETDELVAKRVEGVFRLGLTPILCVGETLAERQNQKTLEVVKRQVEIGLKGIKELSQRDLVIAYEPVWAIGTGITATPEQAEEVHSFIRDSLLRLYGEEIANKIRILYGGSVTPENIASLINQPNIDGVLVGGASLDPEKFLKICSVTL
ncbi:triose-phosphate isomerase [Thermodesulfobacterium sp. TA1]|uniref:triose-phosphate isomerase n=1 Tax=Thermodesulfobacterium sp. TA1 TaxID=2234087 RepID=UPI0012329BFF|nr:triose-phosphate isomerase [Thermodesulfobacterium sp. TA1]QER41336.1 triose-phosphate isomerase [Thermodesulfobacterium sp. TA1]